MADIKKDTHLRTLPHTRKNSQNKWCNSARLVFLTAFFPLQGGRYFAGGWHLGTVDQLRIFPRIYSPHLIDYFRTRGFKAGQEFLTWRPEPGVPGYTALPEEDTWVGELFCLRLRVSPGEQRKNPITKGWSWRGLSAASWTFRNLFQYSFMYFFFIGWFFSLKRMKIFVWNLSSQQHWAERVCKSLHLKKPAQTHQGDLARWVGDTSLEDPVIDAHKVPRPGSNAIHNPVFLHFEALVLHSHTLDNQQWESYASRCKLEAPEAYFWITVVMTSPLATYVTFVWRTNYSGFVRSNHCFKTLWSGVWPKTFIPWPPAMAPSSSLQKTSTPKSHKNKSTAEHEFSMSMFAIVAQQWQRPNLFPGARITTSVNQPILGWYWSAGEGHCSSTLLRVAFLSVLPVTTGLGLTQNSLLLFNNTNGIHCVIQHPFQSFCMEKNATWQVVAETPP